MVQSVNSIMSFSAEEDWRQKKSPKTRRRKWGWQGSRPGSASTETIQSVCCCQSTSDSHTLQIPNIMIHFCSLTLGNNILDISFTSNSTATNCRESKVQNWCRGHVKPPKPNQTGKKKTDLYPIAKHSLVNHFKIKPHQADAIDKQTSRQTSV